MLPKWIKMETQEHQMTAKQSLDIIQSMIDKARFNFARGSFYFILWGVLLIAAGISEFVLGRVLESYWAFIGWPIVGVLGGISSFVYGARTSKNDMINHLDRIYSSLWVSYFITLAIMIITMANNQQDPGGYVMIVTGLPTFLTGYILRFRPLMVGGVVFWVLGILSLYFLEEYRSLIFSFSVLLGYLVPGLMMKTIKREYV